MEPTNINHMIDHIAKLVGIEHVGVGSDMDSNVYDNLPEEYLRGTQDFFEEHYTFRGKLDTDGFDHPKRIYGLTDALVQRGYSDEDIRLVLCENFRRVLGEISSSRS